MNQREVVKRWKGGGKGTASAMSTMGGQLWSYNLLIGTTDKRGRLVLYDYAGELTDATTRHVNLAREVAHIVKRPPRQAKGGRKAQGGRPYYP
jgi:hypothetical protein